MRSFDIDFIDEGVILAPVLHIDDTELPWPRRGIIGSLRPTAAPGPSEFDADGSLLLQPTTDLTSDTDMVL